MSIRVRMARPTVFIQPLVPQIARACQLTETVCARSERGWRRYRHRGPLESSRRTATSPHSHPMPRHRRAHAAPAHRALHTARSVAKGLRDDTTPRYSRRFRPTESQSGNTRTSTRAPAARCESTTTAVRSTRIPQKRSVITDTVRYSWCTCSVTADGSWHHPAAPGRAAT